jgi:threonine synthase
MNSDKIRDLVRQGGGANWGLVCNLCGERFDLGPMVFGCPNCTRSNKIGVLDLTFAPSSAVKPLQARHGYGVGRYLDLLPAGHQPDWISLGEGGTPLVPSKHIGPTLGLSRLYVKNEAANPTGSFKDRFVCVSINIARYFGFEKVVTTSTGNLGVSVAAYAAAAGMDCAIVLPHEAPPAIVDELRRFGAQVFITSLARRIQVFEEIAHSGAWFPIFATFQRPVQNPFGIDGYKTFAYELTEQLGDAPDIVLFPCARGNGLYGAWKGFREVSRYGWSRAAPAMVACQPVGSNSLEVSLAHGSQRSIELPRATSVAKSAAEVVASDHALVALRESGGWAVSVSDDEIRCATEELFREGLCIETSAALPIAGLKHLVRRNLVPPNAAVVCVLTASGLRWPVTPPNTAPAVVRLPDDKSALDFLQS